MNLRFESHNGGSSTAFNAVDGLGKNSVYKKKETDRFQHPFAAGIASRKLQAGGGL